MNYFKINGRSFDVVVTALSENFNILYSENTGRTLDPGAPMTIDPIGTFYGHEVTLQRRKGNEAEYDELFSIISKPRYDGLLVEIAHDQKTISYMAYISSGSRNVEKIDAKNGKILWGEMKLKITPLKAQVIP